MTEMNGRRMASHPFKWFAEQFLIYCLIAITTAFGFIAGSYVTLQICGAP